MTQDLNENEVQDEQTTETQVSDGNSPQDISDILGHAADETLGQDEKNAPAEKKEGVTTEDQGKPDGGKEGTEAQSQTPKPGEEQKPQTEAKPEPSLKDVLKEVLAESKQEKPAEPAKPEPPKDEGPKYNPVVPNEIMAAIEHEDPKVRQQGISAMIGGAMNKVYADIMKEVNAKVQETFSRVPQIIEQQRTVQETAKKMHDTFYEDNPQFGATPSRKKLVAMTALQLAQEDGKEYKGFTDDFRTRLADRIVELTGIPKGKVQKPQETKPAKPAPGFQTGGSGARGTGEKTLADEIAETIGMVVN